MIGSVRLSIWEDVGYTEGCLERPPKTSSLPTPKLTMDIHPSRNDMFSVAKLPVPYMDLYNCSYLRAVVITANDTETKTYYGWIDSVDMVSDNEDSPMTEVHWHIDPWRTWLSQAKFGSGMVKRRPKLTSDTLPPQSYPYRNLEYVAKYNIAIPDIWWVILNFNHNTDDETKQTLWGCYPVNKTGSNIKLPGASLPCPSLSDTVTGRFDEQLSLDPDAINGVWLSPIAPTVYASDYSMTGWELDSNHLAGRAFFAGSYAAFKDSYARSLMDASFSPMPYADGTTDSYQYVLTGFQGETIGVLPWGIKVSYLHGGIIVTGDSCYVRIWLAESSSQTLDASTQRGLVFTYPCLNVGVSSNAWSSYVYSGAREAEIQQRILQNEQNRDLGLSSTNTWGSLAKTLGASSQLAGAISFATGGFKQIANTEAEYAVNTAYNDRIQAVSDYQAANQTSVSIFSAGCFDVFQNNIGGIWLVKMKKDDYSVSQMNSDISIYGATVSEPNTSCQSLIDKGGPLQIANLTVTGAIPNEAKTYFRKAFAGGVRIV